MYNFEIKYEAIYPPSNYLHIVEYLNGKSYSDYPVDSIERRSWHKFRRKEELKIEVDKLFKETDWVIPGQLGLGPLREKYRPFVDEFIELMVNDKFERVKTLAPNLTLDFRKFLRENGLI